MPHHDDQLQHIRELCDQLSDAVKTSSRIREHAEKLRQAACTDREAEHERRNQEQAELIRAAVARLRSARRYAE